MGASVMGGEIGAISYYFVLNFVVSFYELLCAASWGKEEINFYGRASVLSGFHCWWTMGSFVSLTACNVEALILALSCSPGYVVMKFLTLVFSCWMLTPMTRRRMEQTLTWILRERASVLWSRPLHARYDPRAQIAVRTAEKDLLLLRLVLLTLISFLQTYFLPVIGLVDAEKLKPGDLVVSDAIVTARYDVVQKIAREKGDKSVQISPRAFLY